MAADSNIFESSLRTEQMLEVTTFSGMNMSELLGLNMGLLAQGEMTTLFGGNVTSVMDGNDTLSLTETKSSVHDMAYNLTIRKTILYIQIVIGILGAILLFIYMFHTRRLTRVNMLILNLCVADLMVICFSSVVQVVWEHLERRWLAGEIMCRLIKMLMIFGICASTNMLVVIAVDRHQAIMAPLRKQFTVCWMTSIGWGVALLSSAPIFFVFHVRYVPEKDMLMCENIFRGKPPAHRQAFLTYACTVNFLIPLIILFFCYIRIFVKIARKASDSQTSKRQSFKPGKIQLTSNTTSATLHSAKLKTLKMTVVIVSCFIVCGLPYFFAELVMSYGDHSLISGNVYGILGGIAVANSAVNPYIFLLFSANRQCWRNLKLCPARTGPNNRQLMYNGSIRSRDYSTTPYYRTAANTDTYELTSSSTSPSAKRAAHERWSTQSRH